MDAVGGVEPHPPHRYIHPYELKDFVIVATASLLLTALLMCTSKRTATCGDVRMGPPHFTNLQAHVQYGCINAKQAG